MADDILGLGKVFPMDKLLDMVSKSVGIILKPYFDRRDVDTKAYEIEKTAEAKAKEMKIISEAIQENSNLTGGIAYKEDKLAIVSPKNKTVNQLKSTSLKERANDRLDYQEAKRQKNIEDVTAYAADELKDEQPVTNEPVDEDWTTRFFRIVEDVSNEEMQALWGKILAGEIKQPNTYSLRTLELIRNLSKREAETFKKVAKYAIMGNNVNYLFKGKNETILEEKYNIKYADIALLTEIGLIQPGALVQYQILCNPKDHITVLIAGETVLIINIKANVPTIQMPVDVFTNAGNELLKLVKPDPPMEYLSEIAKSIKIDNVEVKHAKIIAYDGQQVKYTMPLLDL